MYKMYTFLIISMYFLCVVCMEYGTANYEAFDNSAPRSLYHHLHPDPRPLRAILYASYHRTLRGLWFRGDDTNASTIIFWGCPDRGLQSSSQTPPMSPHDWGDRPVSSTRDPPKCCALAPLTSRPSRTYGLYVHKYYVLNISLVLLESLCDHVGICECKTSSIIIFNYVFLLCK